MGQSWTNFLFGAYDPAGVITVDKPPAALWPQVLSTKMFGLHGWAMILPQVLEGVATVFLLHRTVRLWAGEAAGLLAALVLTLTPITVAINRDNNPDTLLVLTLVAAAYALTRAMRTTSGLRWFGGAGFLIGLGFMTKMLAAWMVIPAFAAAWLVGARGPWLGRLGKLLIGGVVLVVSSLWWVAMVALWPGSRPYIGGSADGSAWDLVIGYNGLGRIFGGEGGFSISFGGAAGLGRLFNDQVGGQVSWLLPLCGVALVLVLAVAVLRWRGITMPGEPLAAAGWVLWGTWLVLCGLVFATQKGIFHPYYTTQLAPAVAAVTAGFATTLARAHRAGARWALPLGAGAVAVTTAWAYVVIARVPSWNGWVAWLVGAAGMAAIVLLLPAGRRRRLPAAFGVAVLAVLSAPAAWAISVPGSTSMMGGANPTAGPPTMPFGRGAGGGGPAPGGFELPEGMQLPPGMKLPEGMELPEGFPGGLPGGNSGMPPGLFGGGAELAPDQRKILDYAVKQSGSARIKLAAEGGAMFASSFILNSDATVIGMGGFIGIDDAPTLQQLKEWTSSGQLRFVLGSGRGGFGAMMGGASTQRSQWLKENCTEVPGAAYGGSLTASSPMTGGGTTLYDCAAKH
ncbi:glycosyltransferase family 39 protein [Nonomuraea aurantiaca]|uniref:glycosyltransferase family 39 protein n=1 Tax=Nonomuraea aurantiaca TaxID=2878562 RepID=UPI001CD9F960|nr:glycosyltransferase family 39 protein [Nonomuraea aurantiaca]MCA2227883.1 glycosyltransferase family 39 protein [Nonomuraea aurantiaca]